MKQYQETIEYLFNLQYNGIKLGLQNVTNLLNAIGNPQKNWPAIHIAGTNGKGSVAAFLHSILKESGFRVGLYTSPHLVDFSERIRVNDQRIAWETIVKFTQDLKDTIEKTKATFFESTTAIAFRHFAEQEVDIAVVETGLGGRLDATNLVKAVGTVITSISQDHQEYLGQTLTQITKEKAGIIKPFIPCITSNQDISILKTIKEICKEENAPLHLLNSDKQIQITDDTIWGSRFSVKQNGESLHNLEIPLAGPHQVTNAALAILTLQNLKELEISEKNIRQGLINVRWPGRLQVIKENPLALLDVAHNPDGFKNVFRFLKQKFPNKNIWTLVGLAKDKDFNKIADILKKYSAVIGVIQNFSDRAQPVNHLIDALSQNYNKIEKIEKIETGFHQFYHQLSENDILLIIGSHYLAGKFLEKIQIT
jgi:dihydrofolate synthase/folylpolyglutamate synthase